MPSVAGNCKGLGLIAAGFVKPDPPEFLMDFAPRCIRYVKGCDGRLGEFLVGLAVTRRLRRTPWKILGGHVGLPRSAASRWCGVRVQPRSVKSSALPGEYRRSSYAR